MRYPPRSARDEIMYQILPWNLLLPAHELGITKNYRNIGELIHEATANESDKFKLSSFDPVMTCRHLREISSSLRKPKKKCCKREKIEMNRKEMFVLQMITVK